MKKYFLQKINILCKLREKNIRSHLTSKVLSEKYDERARVQLDVYVYVTKIKKIGKNGRRNEFSQLTYFRTNVESCKRVSYVILIS